MRTCRYWFLLVLLPFALDSCSTRLPATAFPRVESHAFTDTDNTLLGQVYGTAAKQHPGLSGFHVINNGQSALMTRIALVEKAQRSIDLQYFSSNYDLTGKLLVEAVVRAADRGVRVRMLLDDSYIDGFSKAAPVLAANPHIEVRVFNPYSTKDDSWITRIFSAPERLSEYDRRMHNKEFIVDNQVGVMGGRNLGDEYFDSSQNDNLRDIDVLAVGAVVPQMSASFDRYWNSDEAFPVSTLNLPQATPQTVASTNRELESHWNEVMHSAYGAALANHHLPGEVAANDTPLIWAQAQFAADSPGKVEKPRDDSTSKPGKDIAQQVREDSQHEFIIFSPYFVPMDKGTAWLTDLVKRGVAVRIVTNSLSSTDMMPAQAGYEEYREALVEGGVELHEIKADPKVKHRMFHPSAQNGLHAKIYMMDRKVVILGSFNLDPRSAKLNTEQALVIHSPELCANVAKVFEQAASLDNSYLVVLSSSIPLSERPAITFGELAWKTRENGKIVYYDFSPHAGFLRHITDGFFQMLPIDKEL